MRVRAIRMGYDGVQRRKPDEEFEWPKDKKLGSWVEPVDKADVASVAEAERAKKRVEHAQAQREVFGGAATDPSVLRSKDAQTQAKPTDKDPPTKTAQHPPHPGSKGKAEE